MQAQFQQKNLSNRIALPRKAKIIVESGLKNAQSGSEDEKRQSHARANAIKT